MTTAKQRQKVSEELAIFFKEIPELDFQSRERLEAELLIKFGFSKTDSAELINAFVLVGRAKIKDEMIMLICPSCQTKTPVKHGTKMDFCQSCMRSVLFHVFKQDQETAKVDEILNAKRVEQ